MAQNEVVTMPPPMPTHSLDEIERLAEAVAKSRMFGIATKEQAMVLMAISQAEGRHPALAARDYHIIQGKPTKTTEAIQRDFLTAGGTIKWHRLDDTIADATFSHPIGGTIRIDWDHARVIKAGLAGREMHQKYTRAMLRARCVSEGVKSVYPAATSGMYTPEEQADIPIIDTTTSPISAAADLDKFAKVEARGLPPEALEAIAKRFGYASHAEREKALLNEERARAEQAHGQFAADPMPEPVTEEDAFGLPPLPIRNEKPAPPRSEIWQEQSFCVAPKELLDGTPDWDRWADAILFLISEAGSEELTKLLNDNKELLNELRRTRGDQYRDIRLAVAARRDELKEAPEDAA